VYQWCGDAFEEGSGRGDRGGSWLNDGSYCQAANRYWSTPTDRSILVGFRLARVPVR